MLQKFIGQDSDKGSLSLFYFLTYSNYVSIIQSMKKKKWTSKDIKELRAALEITQAALGERLGVSGNYIWMLEAGQKIPSETLRLLLDCIARDEKGGKI